MSDLYDLLDIDVESSFVFRFDMPGLWFAYVLRSQVFFNYAIICYVVYLGSNYFGFIYS